MLQQILRIHHSILPDAGEDSFALRSDEQGAFLCVTDGCGGLGSRRYAELDGRTGAYLAARLAAKRFEQMATGPDALSWQTDAQTACRMLETGLFDCLKSFADSHCGTEKSRIVGSMQRVLPTTICAAMVRGKAACFYWAGDSRGYLLDADGLHQYTRDHVRGNADAFEALYLDLPLSNLLSADRRGRLACRQIHLQNPCIVLTATDGTFAALPTPMEFEMMLLDTLRAAKSYADWERKLQRQIAGTAQDDATLLAIPVGFADFDGMKNALLPRRGILQKAFITPVRRRRGDMEFARNRWQLYRAGYDRMEAAYE